MQQNKPHDGLDAQVAKVDDSYRRLAAAAEPAHTDYILIHGTRHAECTRSTSATPSARGGMPPTRTLCPESETHCAGQPLAAMPASTQPLWFLPAAS
jgi:hypothetical protein